MKIKLAESAGFCFGVKRAIDIALRAAATERNVSMLGDIVHNETVVRQIQKAGIKKIKRLRRGKGSILLIRAHGCDKNTYRRAMAFGYKIIDATCPMVKEIHRIAQRMEERNYEIIVIGDTNHEEVRGIIGHLKRKAIVIDGPKDIARQRIAKLSRACVVVQSTQNLDSVQKIVATLKEYIPHLKFFNTICKPTRMKQQEIKTLPLENDVMIIIGSKESANTKRLYEISKSLNKQSYRVNSTREIKRGWFKKVKTVGITAGASTPEATIREIISHIAYLSRQSDIRPPLGCQ